MKNMSWCTAPLALIISCLSGCVGGISQAETNKLVAIEAEKVAKIQLGMSIAEVRNIMGAEMLDFGGDMEARPIRTDKFMSKEGAPIEVQYYRSSIKRNDGLCTDDEMTAVIFVKGKVDAITSGDTSKTVIEVRRR